MTALAEIISDVDPVPIQEAAREFGLNVDTLYRWIRDGRLRRLRKGGDRRTYVDREELRREVDWRVDERP